MTDGPLPDRDLDPAPFGPAERAEAAALWRRVAWPAPEPQARLAELPLDANDLAAWIEGRLDGERRDRVEAWLAQDPTALAAVMAPPPADGAAVPLEVVRRARALMPAARPTEPAWLRAVGWSCVAVLVACAGVAGFTTGAESARARPPGALYLAANTATDLALPGGPEGGLIGDADY